MNSKKIAAAGLAALLALGTAAAAGSLRAAAAGTQSGSQQSGNEQSNTVQQSVAVKAKSAVMVEASTGKILYENNSREKLSPASISKIMTELLVLQAVEKHKFSFADKITCSAHASSMGGSDIWLEPGEVMTAGDLFKAMAVNSANDAAVALGEKVAGSEQAFVVQMNAQAKALGMTDTHFTNCTGLDADNNITSARDVMLMSKELIKHREIFNYCTIWTDSLRGGKTALYNTNRLIRFYTGANGLKTGSTSKAGYNLSATALRDNMQLIAVVMGCETVNDRFSSAENLLDYGFANWSLVTPQIKTGKLTVGVEHGVADSVQAAPEGSVSVLTEKGSEGGVTQKVSVVDHVVAPVSKGQVLGQITFWINGKNVGSAPVKAQSSVQRLTFLRAFAALYGVMTH